MKRLHFLFILVFCALSAAGQSGATFTQKHVDLWRCRSQAGFKFFSTQPDEFGRIEQWKTQFMAAPFKAGNIGSEAAGESIYTGYNTGEKPNQSSHVPAWQGKKACAAAWWGLVKKDTSVINRVYQMLLRQARQGGTSDLDNWGDPSKFVGSDGKVDTETGFHDAGWMAGLAYTWDYIRWAPWLPPSGVWEIEQWAIGNCTWLGRQVQLGALGQCFPNRLQNDYTVTGRDALPAGAAYGIWASADPYNKTLDAQGRILTHVGGFPISHLARHYGNRVADKYEAIILWWAITGNGYLGQHAHAFPREQLRYSTYPGGMIAETGVRACDRFNSKQGYWYGQKNVQCLIVYAQVMAIKGDTSFFADSTNIGLHGTGGGYKSLRQIVRFVARAEAGQINYMVNYYDNDPKSPGYKTTTLQPVVGQTRTTSGTLHNIFGRLNVIEANQYYNRAEYAALATSIPWPATNLATAGPGFWCPYGGVNLEKPSVILSGFQTATEKPFRPGRASVAVTISNSDITLPANTRTWALVANSGGAAARYAWSRTQGPQVELKDASTAVVTLNPTAAAPIPAGTYKFQTIAYMGGCTRYETSTVTVLPTP